MKTITITISKAEALHQANLRNYYAGESAKVGDMVEIATKMQTSEDNADVMEKFVIDAATHLVQVLAPVCIDVQVELGDTITYTTKVSDLYAESQTNVIQQQAFEYIVNQAILQWLLLAFPSKAEMFATNCGTLEFTIKQAINKRLKPTER